MRAGKNWQFYQRILYFYSWIMISCCADRRWKLINVFLYNDVEIVLVFVLLKVSMIKCVDYLENEKNNIIH